MWEEEYESNFYPTTPSARTSTGSSSAGGWVFVSAAFVPKCLPLVVLRFPNVCLMVTHVCLIVSS